PKIQDAMTLADEPRSVNHVGPVLDNGLNQALVFGRVVFQIGVLNDDHVSGDVAEAFAQGRPFALIALLKKNPNRVPLTFPLSPRGSALGHRAGEGVIAGQLTKNVWRAVGAAIVNDDNLLGDRHSLHAADQLSYPLFLVENRN